MAISCSRAGRPCLVADINAGEDPDIALWDEFYEVCRHLCYGEIMALSRFFQVAPRTIERWKYGNTYPGDGKAKQTINWAKAGKPMKERRPFPEKPGMI